MDRTRSPAPRSLPQPSSSARDAVRGRETVVLILLGVIGAVFFFGLYGHYQPAARFDLRLDRSRIQELTDALLVQHGADLADYPIRNTSFDAENVQLTFYQANHLSDEERARLERHHPTASWIVQYASENGSDRYIIRVDPAGRMIGLSRVLADETPGASLSIRDAKALSVSVLAQRFGVDLSEYEEVNAQSVRQPDRTDHTFSWRQTTPGPADSGLLLSATVVGDRVDGWAFDVELPRAYRDRYAARTSRGNLWELLSIAVSIAVWLAAVVVFALRFRENEVSVRNGLVAALVLMIAFSLWLIESLPSLKQSLLSGESSFTPSILYFNLILQVFFLSIGYFFVWVSGESITRELWPAKLRALDGLFARYIFFPEIGAGILRGFAVGLLHLGLWYAGVALLTYSGALWLKSGEIDQFMLSSVGYFFFFVPVGTPVMLAVYSALLGTGYGFLFSMGFVRQKTSRTWLALLISVILFGGLFETTTIFADRWVTVVMGAVLSLVVYAAYVRYDLLTGYVSLFVYAVLPGAMLLFSQSAPNLHLGGAVLLVVLAGVFAYGLVAVVWGTPLDAKAVQPRYARHISERERLKLELDVARRAQLHMLPSFLPVARGLDIAAFSEPATEVGGDYFDFFPLDDDHIGFAIGDVSGKGMPAALYMTMLKGSLQSQVSIHVSPKDVLSHLNRTFYKAAERSFFVTLLYGIIDLSASTLTFARAGHHPVLLYRPTADSVSFLAPPGIGIGLESGPAFERIIRNETLAMIPGDTLILYTDGLTEGRNAASEEYGEDRLTRLVTEAPKGSAEDLMARVRAGYASFIGHVPPHDDLTCIVIKVT